MNRALSAPLRPSAEFSVSGNDSFVRAQCNLTKESEGSPLSESRPIGVSTDKREICNFCE